MELAEYGFAFFIFLLACIFALLCKYLFGRTKNRLQALDEKEKKLLAFYSTLEDMMDEFNDSAVQANSELAQHISAMRNVAASLRGNNSEQAMPPRTSPPLAATMPIMATDAPSAAPSIQAAAPVMRQQAPSAAMRAAVTAPARPNIATAGINTANIRNANFDTPIFEVVSEAAQAAPLPMPEPQPPKTEPDRPTRILTLHRNGMDRLHIAKELSVTLSEVDLVLGIAGQR